MIFIPKIFDVSVIQEIPNKVYLTLMGVPDSANKRGGGGGL